MLYLGNMRGGILTGFGLLVVMLSSCSSGTGSGNHTNNRVSQSDSSEVDPITQKIDTAYLSSLLMGTLDIRSDSSFVLLPSEYTVKPIYLHVEAANSLINMINAAKKDNVELFVLSGYRSFEDQRAIWTRKWNERSISDDTEKCKNIMLYSAMPKTSRHHWGTDVDLNSLDNSYFNGKQGEAVNTWLCRNAVHFGFQCVYTDKTTTKRMGYEMEKWHWSYVPLSSKYLEFYNALIDYNDITGFPGSQSAASCRAIEDYVNGVIVR